MHFNVEFHSDSILCNKRQRRNRARYVRVVRRAQPVWAEKAVIV